MSRIAEKLLELIANEQQQEIDELKAHVELLREALRFIAQDYSVNNHKYLHPYAVAEEALEQTTAQSLNNIKAQVEEETIERILGIIEFESENADLEVDYRDWRPPAKEAADLMYRYARSGIKNMPRKYKEQSDED